VIAAASPEPAYPDDLLVGTRCIPTDLIGVILRARWEPAFTVEADVCKGQIEARDRSTVHLLVLAVAAMHPHY